MTKVKTGWKLPPMPLPVALLGANVGNKPNFFTIVWFNMVHDDPPLIGAAMSKKRYTKKGIQENGTFSINIPSSHLNKIVDYCGLVSGFKVDKSTLFNVFYGELKSAPMISECALNIECKLYDSKDFPHTELIIGEIIEIYYEKKCLTKGNPDYKKLDPMIFFMPNGPYFKAGNYLAEAYKVGENYKLDK